MVSKGDCMLDKKHLDNYIKALRECIVKRRGSLVLDKSKIDNLQFSIALTKISQAIENKEITAKVFLERLRRK